MPWEHVFVYRNLEVCWNQWWQTPAHSYGNYQAQVRYATKLRFLLGLAKRVTEITGVGAMPPVRVQLGELAALATIVDLMIDAQETRATIDAEGAVWPAKTALYSVMSLQSELNARMVDMLRELSGGSMIMLPPSLSDFDHPDAGRDLERYIASPGHPARDRVALLKMAWDLVGTEFAGRHQQYEKFYGGASFLVKQNMFRAYDFDAATTLVDRALAGIAEPASRAAA
ncbi:4-hydroxyphenylacetate 3-hydroxylase C-terminal domain-containing protein [Pigmentiphaga sp.]|uniref:4-hydroxyphenylacetate 3-hydroxylase C-terminal domain-containing protein n=1 Tax=Pigmentiphaga sp. TaxID=1977564 RepID=UPI0029CAA180|nr:4-hydroxyphenylacetate 3-hydroxylase C-terminal domain-containing protein [Pigmentiphaga sp.]